MDRLEAHKEPKKRKKLPKAVTAAIITAAIVIAGVLFWFFCRPVYVSPETNTAQAVAQSVFQKKSIEGNAEEVGFLIINDSRYLRITANGETFYIRCYKIGRIYFTDYNISQF